MKYPKIFKNKVKKKDRKNLVVTFFIDPIV